MLLKKLAGRSSLACLLGIAVSGVAMDRARAEAVDTELLLLVDVSRPGLTDSEFDTLMSGYASALSSPAVLSAIQSGASGRIAVAMMFFGNSTIQQLVVPWMPIADTSDAAQFASLVSGLARPFVFGFSDPAAGIAAATPTFGTETGGAANGFESSVQVLEVAASGVPNPFAAGATSNASNTALAAGVDLINANSIGGFGAIIENYYEQNVIGSTIPGVPASSGTSPANGALAGNLTTSLAQTAQVGADVSTNSVPEPGPVVLVVSALGFGLMRRRR